MNSTESFTTIQRKILFPKEVIIGWISSLVEAYNMAIYSFTAPFLATMLFQGVSEQSAVLFSYCLMIFGTCLFYPAGALYFGFLGDKQGRQKICIYSTLGLGIATGALGIFPISFLGNYAWIFFLFFISLQHFFSAGEYSGSIVFSLEHNNKTQNGLMSALSCFSACLGLMIASGLATISYVTQNEFWVRCCFLLGALGGIISFYLKNHCQETPVFKAISQEDLKKVNLLNFIKDEWKTISIAFLAMSFFVVSYTFIFIFLPLIQIQEMGTQNFDNFISLTLYGLFLILGGFLADNLGLKNVIIAGSFLFSFTILPICFFCTDLLLIQLLLMSSACLVIGPVYSWLIELFRPEVRCRGIFISSALAIAFFLGTTTPICLLIFEKYHSLAICALYPFAFGLSLACFLLWSEASRIVK